MQKTDIKPYHLIGAFIYLLDGNKVKKDTASFSWFLYKLKEKHPELGGVRDIFFRYTKGDPFPLCGALEDYWAILKYSKVLKSMGDIDPHHLWIDDKDKASFKEDLDIFDDKSQSIIKTYADKFNNMVDKNLVEK